VSNVIIWDQKFKNDNVSFLSGIFAVLLCTIFGANSIAIKISLSSMGVFTTAGARCAIASAAILVWAKITKTPLNLKKGQIFHLLIISLISIVEWTLLYSGINKSNASRGTLLTNLQPFFVLILAHFFIQGDHFTKRKLLAIVIGFCGVAFLLIERNSVNADFRIGDTMVLGQAFLWACKTIYTKRIIDWYKPLRIVFYPLLFSAPLLILQGIIWDAPMAHHIDSRILLSILYQGIVTVAFGFVAWNILLQKYGAVSLNSFVFLMPVSGVLFGRLILGEPITYNIFIALALITSGILVIQLKKSYV
jgi:drug/metabolite transporter (DMT)-like permease